MTCCVDTGVNGILKGLGGLGQATELADIFVHARDLWHDLENLLGIGAGRREADIVVPVQNDVHRILLAPVSDFLTQYKTGQIHATCAELQSWKAKVEQGEQQWLAFLHTTEWQDGRAAQQGEATLAPYFTNAKRDLTQFISECGGIGGGIITDEQGNINWPIIAIGGVALLALMRRK